MPPDKRSIDEPSSDERAQIDLRSYGRRRGRKISPRQQRLIDELLPKVRLDLSRDFQCQRQPARASREEGPAPLPAGGETPPDHPLSDVTKRRGVGGDIPQWGAGLAPLAKPPSREVWLEIGFGGGEHLVWQAAHNPETLIIGCEPFEEGVVKVLTAIEERGLANIRLHPDDARDVLRWLPEASIARAFILFPDPWPKARHKKRRLVNPTTLGVLARAIRPGGMLRLATDIGDYARTMLIALQAVPEFDWTAQHAEDWRQRPPDWPETRYEQKALREGRRSTYLTFERLQGVAGQKN